MKYPTIPSFPLITRTQEDGSIKEHAGLLTRLSPNSSKLTLVKSRWEARLYSSVVGDLEYNIRSGVEIAPQEYFMFEFVKRKSPNSPLGIFKTIDVKKARQKAPTKGMQFAFELEFMFPVLKADMLTGAQLASNIYAPCFYTPYTKILLPEEAIQANAPELHRYFETIVIKDLKATDTSRLGTRDAFGFTRWGAYSLSTPRVILRDNTAWNVYLVETIKTTWGTLQIPLLAKHVSCIAQTKNNKEFIQKEEAHYICAVLSNPNLKKYIKKSNDSRSFELGGNIKLPQYNAANPIHQELASFEVETNQGLNLQTAKQIARLVAKL